MYLLDTNLVSELRKVRTGKANAGVAEWSATADPASLFISAITVHELELGVLMAERKDSEQGILLRNWLEEAVLPAFDGRIIAIDSLIARRSAGLHVPNPCPFRDGLIAATGLVHSLTVVTRNVRDFNGTGVNLLNPWT